MASIAKDLSRPDPMLLPPRDEGYILHGVYEKIADGCRGELVLDCGDAYLQIRVDENTDSLCTQYHDTKFKRSRGHRSLAAVSPWDRWLGKVCGWTWVAVNQQGYFDSVMLSFDGIVPCVLLHALGSSIAVFTILANKD